MEGAAFAAPSNLFGPTAGVLLFGSSLQGAIGAACATSIIHVLRRFDSRERLKRRCEEIAKLVRQAQIADPKLILSRPPLETRQRFAEAGFQPNAG